MDSDTTSLRTWSHKISLTQEFSGVVFLMADRSSFDGRSKAGEKEIQNGTLPRKLVD
jgi:hypothetical protein